MILYVTFSYLFMLGFCGYSEKVGATTKTYSAIAFVLSPVAMPLFIGLSLAAFMDEEK